MNETTCKTCGLPTLDDVLDANERMRANGRTHASLRDELAMAALATPTVMRFAQYSSEAVAREAYALADAMLVVRENDLAGWKMYPELPETERSVLVLIGGVAHEPALVRARCIRDDRQGEPPRRWALYEAVGLPRRFVELGAVAAWREAPPLPPSLKTW